MQPNVIISMNNALLECVRKRDDAPGPIARIGAMMHLAMFEAVNRLSGAPYESYLPKEALILKTPGALPSQSAYYAARRILAVSFPKFPDISQAKPTATVSPNFLPADYPFEVDTFLAKHPLIGLLEKELLQPSGNPTGLVLVHGPSKTFGEAIANALLAERANDQANQAGKAPLLSFGSEVPGEWRPTDGKPPVTPHWGDVWPFSRWKKAQLSQFLPTVINVTATPDYASLLKSPEYASQVNEVKSLGAANSTTRTSEMTEIAFFWANDVKGTSKPPGQLFTLTQIVAQQQGTTQNLLDTARLFALVGVALVDASIVAWHVKYQWPTETNPKNIIRLWRPETAIHLAHTDNNPATAPDPTWQPLSVREDKVTHFSPAFPAYISGHATFAAAHAAVMQQFYKTDKIAFIATTEDPSALDKGASSRPYPSFSAAAKENADSRIYLGVHYRWDAAGGLQSGEKVGKYVVAQVLQLKKAVKSVPVAVS